jgi:Mg/Co/Ni transporter MgtE
VASGPFITASVNILGTALFFLTVNLLFFS